MNPTLVKSLLLFAAILTSIISYAQQQPLPCGNGPLDAKLIAAHPEIQVKMDSLEAFTKRFIANHKPSQITTRSGEDTAFEYTIPVVFHIIHNYGPEDISDSQVVSEMTILNQDYNKLNPDTAEVIPQFKSIAANCHITFKLAQIDPNGNCTTGIEHIHDLLTYDGGDNVKPLYDWPRNQYLNIWSVAAIKIGNNDVAGYAYFPSEVDGVFGAAYDGVIILSSFVGNIGTSDPYTSRAVTHEIGHTMNLYHPWGATNSPGVACGDDNVEDTPPTEGSYPVGNCNLSLDHCNPPVIENVQNYMDYSYCSKMFTNGQKARMYAALNDSQSERIELWSPANLAATGVDGSVTATCSPKADFTSNYRFVCNESSVLFTDMSWRGAETGRTWLFGKGASIATSTLKNPSVTFDSSGWQTVTLISTNAAGSDTLVQKNYIYVSPPISDFVAPFTEDFSNAARFNDQWFSLNPEGNVYKWVRDSTTGYNSSSSAMLYNFGDFFGDYKDLISPSFDLSAGGSYQLSFVYSGATQASNINDINDSLKVYASYTCGSRWIPILTIAGVQLANAGLWPTNYVPAANSTNWTFVTAKLPGLFDKAKIRFKFEAVSGGSSNNLFLDNINVSIATGVPQINMGDASLKIYPDPAGESATISYHLTEDNSVKIELLDISGRIISQPVNSNQQAGDHAILIDNTTLANGIYLVRLWIGGVYEVKKLVIAKN